MSPFQRNAIDRIFRLLLWSSAGSAHEQIPVGLAVFRRHHHINDRINASGLKLFQRNIKYLIKEKLSIEELVIFNTKSVLYQVNE